MRECKTLTKALAEQYRKASKSGKGRILDEFVEASGRNRCYAGWLLRHHGLRVEVEPRLVMEGDARKRIARPRRLKYGKDVIAALTKIWEMLDYMSGKRLAAILPEVIPKLVACRELRIKKAVRKQLLEISPATIDRRLKPERDRHTLRARATTKPGTLLKHQVPIRTFSDWDQVKPGYLEMDLVGHYGGTAEGDYCFTLDLTDVATGWTEQAAVQNKAQIWVFEALQEIRKRLPFPVLGLDSDNGSEFINQHLVRFCRQERIAFSRSRPYQKNDTCYVEQKNWSLVRRFVGYARYDTQQARQTLNELYRVLRDYSNFFLPSMKLIEKTRDGAHVYRRHDTPQTPYRRLLHSPEVSPADKRRLTLHYKKLNPAALHRQIQRIQKRLDKIAVRLNNRKEAA